MKSLFTCAALAIALSTAAFAQDTREKILSAVKAVSPSIVKVKFECRQTDGKSSQEFETSGVVVGPGLIMVSQVDQVDPPVGGRFQKPAHFVVSLDKESKAKARFLGKDEEINLALLEVTGPVDDAVGGKEAVLVPLTLTPLKELGLAQEVLVIGKLGADSDFAPAFSLVRVTSVVVKPAGPPQYGTDNGINEWTGSPVLTLEGAVIGFVGQNPSEQGGGQRITMGGRTFYVGGGGRGGSRILCTSDFADFLADPSKFLRRKGWLGVRGMQALGKDLAEHFKVDKGGVIIGEVLDRSPAQRAGLVSGDIVLRIDGEKLDIEEDKDVEKLTKRIQRTAGGAKMSFTVLRKEGEGYAERQVDVEIEEEPKRDFEVEEWEEKVFGLRVKPLTRDFLDEERLPLDTEGVRVTFTESASFAQLAGLQRDDIIQGVILVRAADLNAFQKRMEEVIAAKEPEVCFSVIRGGKKLFLCVRPEWGLAEGKK